MCIANNLSNLLLKSPSKMDDGIVLAEVSTELLIICLFFMHSSNNVVEFLKELLTISHIHLDTFAPIKCILSKPKKDAP